MDSHSDGPLYDGPIQWFTNFLIHGVANLFFDSPAATIIQHRGAIYSMKLVDSRVKLADMPNIEWRCTKLPSRPHVTM